MWLSYTKNKIALSAESLENLDDHEIWGKITELFHVVGKARTAELKPHGIRPEHSHILRTLAKLGGETTINELAEITLKNHNTISLLARRMEKAGLISMVKDKSKNRYKITITEKGVEKFNSIPLQSTKLIFSVLTEDEKRIFVDILIRLDKKTRDLLGLDYVPPLFRE